MSLETNKAIVRRFVEEVQSEHNLDATGEFIDPNMIDHSGISEHYSPNPIEHFKSFFSKVLLASFPDIKFSINMLLAEGDKVVTHKTFRGTHKGEFRGVPATGRKIAVDMIDIFRIAAGKMVEHWVIFDWMGLMRQLGAMPPQPQKRQYKE